MSGDPIAVYFTAERLKRYRELHRRYPLWCGHWPTEDRYWAQKFTVFQSRQAAEIEWYNENVDRWWKGLPSISERMLVVPSAEAPTVEIREFSPDDLDVGKKVDTPAIFATLLGAIEHTCLRYDSGLGGAQQMWPTELAKLITKVVNTSRLWLMHVFAWDQFYIDLQSEKSPTSPAVRKQLDREWLAVGRKIGVIPPTRSGNRKMPLSEETRSALLDETQSLVRAVQSAAPSVDDLVDCEQLLLSEPKACVEILTYVEELAKKEGRQPDLKNWRKAVAPKFWCLRLMFPMLSVEELRWIRDGRSDDRVFRPLIKMRFGILEKSLSQSAARRKKPSQA